MRFASTAAQFRRIQRNRRNDPKGSCHHRAISARRSLRWVKSSLLPAWNLAVSAPVVLAGTLLHRPAPGRAILHLVIHPTLDGLTQAIRTRGNAS